MRTTSALLALSLSLSLSLVAGQLTCPASGDDAYDNKPTLDELNNDACGVDDTSTFTALLTDETVSPSCTIYCAACEAGICSLEQSGSTSTIRCSDSSKCTLCQDPTNCNKSAAAANRATLATAALAVAVPILTGIVFG